MDVLVLNMVSGPVFPVEAAFVGLFYSFFCFLLELGCKKIEQCSSFYHVRRAAKRKKMKAGVREKESELKFARFFSASVDVGRFFALPCKTSAFRRLFLFLRLNRTPWKERRATLGYTSSGFSQLFLVFRSAISSAILERIDNLGEVVYQRLLQSLSNYSLLAVWRTCCTILPVPRLVEGFILWRPRESLSKPASPI